MISCPLCWQFCKNQPSGNGVCEWQRKKRIRSGQHPSWISHIPALCQQFLLCVECAYLILLTTPVLDSFRPLVQMRKLGLKNVDFTTRVTQFISSRTQISWVFILLNSLLLLPPSSPQPHHCGHIVDISISSRSFFMSLWKAPPFFPRTLHNREYLKAVCAQNPRKK